MIRSIVFFAVDTRRAIVFIVYKFMIYICRNIALSSCGDFFQISTEWESSIPKQPGKSWNQTEDSNGYLDLSIKLLKPYIFPVPAEGPENKS